VFFTDIIMFRRWSDVSPGALTTYKWQLRFDNDVIQRCLGILFVWIVLRALASFVGLPPLAGALPEYALTLALICALAKSAASLEASNKAVLVTGEGNILPEKS